MTDFFRKLWNRIEFGKGAFHLPQTAITEMFE